MTDIIYMLVHLAVFAVILALWRAAPDLVQRAFLVVAACSMAVYLFGDFLAIYGIDNVRGGKELFGISALWQVKSIAGAFAHGALLLYFGRQWWIKTEMCKQLKEVFSDGPR